VIEARFIMELSQRLRQAVHEIIVGMDDAIYALLLALLSEGHVLLEGPPGIAKTYLARAFAYSLGLQFRRIQFTADLLPSDITGLTIYNKATGELEFRRGPIFANIVLADEINRASPRSQSALLEAMQERQVTVEGNTYPLPRPFLLIATQNPIELEGSLIPSEFLYLNGELKRGYEIIEEAKENGESSINSHIPYKQCC